MTGRILSTLTDDKSAIAGAASSMVLRSSVERSYGFGGDRMGGRFKCHFGSNCKFVVESTLKISQAHGSDGVLRPVHVLQQGVA